MRRIVTHKAPDLDAISSTWIIKRFLPNWDGAEIEFVNAGEKFEGNYENEGEVIEKVDGIETIHVDTGLGSLDHHQTSDNNTCAASLTFKFILSNPLSSIHKHETKKEAVKRIVELVIDDDHFQEIYYPESGMDIYEAGIVAIIKGYKMMHQKDDMGVLEYGMEALDAILHNLEAKLWAVQEIEERGINFNTKWGRGIGIETINDEVLKIAQMIGYNIAVRKDPSVGFIRIKARPSKRIKNQESRIKGGNGDIDLTPVYDELKRLDPESSWFLHVSKRMLLNGSSKNTEMKGSKLTLNDVIEVLKSV